MLTVASCRLCRWCRCLAVSAAAAVPASAQRYDNRYDRYDNDTAIVATARAAAAATLPASSTITRSCCRGARRIAPRRSAMTTAQCNRRDGRRYNFVLHGLWPQYERGFPGDCQIGRRPYVPDNVIEDAMDVMPSKPLIIHEYRKHGTCSGMEPSRYFETARAAVPLDQDPVALRQSVRSSRAYRRKISSTSSWRRTSS